MQKLRLILIILLAIFLSGCQSTLLVRNTKTNQLVPLIKDYAGLHGYTITYENDTIGSFRLFLGTVYIPNTSQTTKTAQSHEKITSTNVEDKTLTSYEQTTWQTVSVPGHYVDATAIIRLIQQNNDTAIILESNDNLGSSVDDLQGYLKDLGYSVISK